MPVPIFAPIVAQAATTAGAVAESLRQLFARQSAFELGAMCGAFLVGSVIQVLAYWISAKVVVANEHATLARAGQLWLLSVVVGIGMVALLIITLLLAASAQQPVLLLLVGGGWLLLAFAIALLLPAKVFQTGLLRSFGVLVLSFVLILAAQVAIDQARDETSFTRWRPLQAMLFENPEGRQRRLRHLLKRDGLTAIELDLDRLSAAAERKKSFTERQEGLRSVFAALEQRRPTIKAQDKEALADYEAIRQRYEELVKIMRDDYTASQTPPPKTPSAP